MKERTCHWLLRLAFVTLRLMRFEFTPPGRGAGLAGLPRR